MKSPDSNSGHEQDSRQWLTSVAPPRILVLEKKKTSYFGGWDLLTDKLRAIFSNKYFANIGPPL